MIDPFAQTAGTDDLFFDDDIVPVSEPVVEVQAPAPEPEPAVPSPSKGGLGQSQYASRGAPPAERGGGRGRGRGNRNGRGRGRGGVNAQSQDVREKPEEATKETEAAGTPAAESTEADAADTTSATPKDQTAKATASVRGDRTLTGGPKRARLTEEELAAKLATMRSKNEAIAAAHARAEADRANSEAREAIAAQQTAERKRQQVEQAAERRRQQAEKQKMERQNRQAMMGERERNRQRKLDALAGREWDNEKEDGFAGTGEERRRGAARGAYGGVAPMPRAPAGADEGAGYGGGGSEDWGHQKYEGYGDDYHYGGRGGRGGRGRGRGGRGGRGGARGGAEFQIHGAAKQQEQHPPTASDFPELPGASKPPPEPTTPKKLDFPIHLKTNSPEGKDAGAGDAERPGLKTQDSFGLPAVGAGKSWADQVEGA